MKKFWLEVLHKTICYSGFAIGAVIAQWLWKHFIGQ